MRYSDSYTAPSGISLHDLKQLINTGEGTYLEFKRTISSPEKIAREISAFANSNGGTLLVGVNDDKTLAGVESHHEEEFLLEQSAQSLCSPAVEYTMEVIPYYQREILMIRVSEAAVKPVKITFKGKTRVFVRLNDRSVRASDEKISIMERNATDDGVTFEYGPNEQKLLRYLNEYERITVREYSNLVDISPNQASSILVNLVSAGILRLFNHDQKDYFTLAS